MPIVAGIIVSAVAAELVIAHPGEERHANELLPLAAGPVLLLVGSLIFKASVLHAQWRRRVVAIVAVIAVTVSARSSRVWRRGPSCWSFSYSRASSDLV